MILCFEQFLLAKTWQRENVYGKIFYERNLNWIIPSASANTSCEIEWKTSVHVKVFLMSNEDEDESIR